MTAHGTEKEMLRQVVRSAHLVAADQVGIVGLQVQRRDEQADRGAGLVAHRIGQPGGPGLLHLADMGIAGMEGTPETTKTWRTAPTALDFNVDESTPKATPTRATPPRGAKAAKAAVPTAKANLDKKLKAAEKAAAKAGKPRKRGKTGEPPGSIQPDFTSFDNPQAQGKGRQHAECRDEHKVMPPEWQGRARSHALGRGINRRRFVHPQLRALSAAARIAATLAA